MNTDKNTKTLELTENDCSQIASALSYIWMKFNCRLKTISINNKTGVLVFGKHTEKIIVNLKNTENDNWYTNKIKNLENRKSTKMVTGETDKLKKDLHKINKSIDDNPEEIWTSINKYCHNKFGYNEDITPTNKEDLEWAMSTLSTYANWDKMKDYHALINLWISKIRKYEQKGKEKCEKKDLNKIDEKFIRYGQNLHKLAANSLQLEPEISSSSTTLLQRNNLSCSLNVMGADPIKVTDEESAKARANQWVQQRNEIEKVGTAFKSFKLYHRLTLKYVYDDINKIAKSKYPGKKGLQRKFEKDIICAQEGVVKRSELRMKTSAIRIHQIIDSGITFDQINKIGMKVTDFEVGDKLYNKFLSSLNIDHIKNLNKVTNNVLNIVQPIIQVEVKDNMEVDGIVLRKFDLFDIVYFVLVYKGYFWVGEGTKKICNVNTSYTSDLLFYVYTIIYK
ncbi:hypothetical protein C1645_741517 [Glomus cerebriforme]|uniref:Uncharacterized protein n=1 Tax=Glomus cerebriforme TaxID=658196 RepID=A0A397SLK0_9GLOM|nr:hypothetical protein C1645_741517 [Glomus cerebriforme]